MGAFLILKTLRVNYNRKNTANNNNNNRKI